MNRIDKPTQILFARHGESTANVEGVLGSNDPSVELTNKGIRQATLLGEKIVQLEVPRKELFIVSSPLLRARQTAEEVARVVGYPLGQIIVVDQLSERRGGDFIRRPVTELHGATDQEVMDAGGEGLDEFAYRMKLASFILGQIASGETKTMAVIGHAEARRMAEIVAIGGNPHDINTIERPANGELLHYPMTPLGQKNADAGYGNWKKRFPHMSRREAYRGYYRPMPEKVTA